MGSLCLLLDLSQPLHQLHGLPSNLLCFLLCIFTLFFLALEQSPDGRIAHKYTLEKKKKLHLLTVFSTRREQIVNSNKVGLCALLLHLPLAFLLPGLRLHLLHLDGVGFAAAHVEVMVPDAQGQDAFVDAKARHVKYKVLLNGNVK